MALVVEDGTGLTNADSFVSVAVADTYCETIGYSEWAAATTEEKETALRRATSHLKTAYSYDGTKINGRTQALPFPRKNLTDSEGYAVDSDSVPKEIDIACIELAVREQESPGILSPDVIPSEGVKREKLGPMEVEYTNTRTDADASRPVVLIASELIAPFLKSGTSATGESSLFGMTVRA